MEDRERAHALGAHAYVTKEASFPLYRDLLEGLLSDVAHTAPSTGARRTVAASGRDLSSGADRRRRAA